VWGSGGGGVHAAAGAFLDAVAARCRAEGLPATAVSWGPWAVAGQLDADMAETVRRHGLLEMAPARALSALRLAVGGGVPHAVVADVDWSRLAAALTATRPVPLLADLPEARGAAPEPAPLARLTSLPRDERRSALVDLVRSATAAVLGHGAARDVSARNAFRDLGLDSVTAVELRNRLSAVTGLPLPATMIFDYPTPRDLAAYLDAELSPAPAQPSAAATEVAQQLETASADEVLAFIDREFGSDGQ
jgi:acyl carrier protein